MEGSSARSHGDLTGRSSRVEEKDGGGEGEQAQGLARTWLGLNNRIGRSPGAGLKGYGWPALARPQLTCRQPNRPKSKLSRLD